MGFESQTTLGRTGLRVGRLGLSAGYGIGPDAMEFALGRGQNLFYWGALRRPAFGRALREMALRDRDSVIIALQSFARSGGWIKRSVSSALRNLGIEHADILILGYWSGQPWPRVVESALQLKERGIVRYLALSSHNHELIANSLNEDIFDVIMLRYNPSHRHAEENIFPALSAMPLDRRPGVMSFTATRWGHLLDSSRMPKGIPPLLASDCYRYSLTRPEIDLTLCGPANFDQTRQAITSLDSGPLSNAELLWANKVGEYVAQQNGLNIYERF